MSDWRKSGGADAKAKRKVQELSQKWSQKISTDQVFGIYRNSEKYTVERQMSLLKQMFRPYSTDFEKNYLQFEEDVRKNNKTPIDAFVIFVNNITIVSGSQKPQIPVKPSTDSKISTKSEFESPALCSTRVDTNSNETVVISEVNIVHLSLSSSKIQQIPLSGKGKTGSSHSECSPAKLALLVDIFAPVLQFLNLKLELQENHSFVTE